MQQISTDRFRQADRRRALGDSLARALGDLRQQPDSDLKTLRKVDAVLHQHAGQRLTIAPGQALAGRLAQARVLAHGLPATQAAKRIMDGLGVSPATGWRYLKRLKNV